MKEDHQECLREALDDLAALAGKKGLPNRYHARALLVPLGFLVQEDADAAGAWIERIRQATAPFDEAWREAVEAELSLACAEHVHAADPRYLDLPNYDFEYTLGARERLEARLQAARVLALEVPPTLERGVERADRLLAPYVARRRPENE